MVADAFACSAMAKGFKPQLAASFDSSRFQPYPKISLPNNDDLNASREFKEFKA